MEKYGTIPDKFTKAWWEYIWEYYRWHIISTTCVILSVASLIYSIATATKYDMYIAFVGTTVFEESKTSLKEFLIPLTEEKTDNDVIDILFDEYPIDASVMADTSVAQMDSAVSMKLMAELEAGSGYLYMISKGNLENFYALAGCLADTSLYAEGREDVFKDENGRACAVSLAGNEKIEALGIDCSDLYIAVRSLYERDKNDEERKNIYENSLKIAEFILGE